MNTLAKIICIGMALAWMHGASAAPAPSSTNGAIDQPLPKKPAASNKARDRVTVEQRLENKATLSRKRTDRARKSAPQSGTSKK